MDKRDTEKDTVNISFEEIFKQNERRIYYHMQRLGIRDQHHDFYSEGLYAMWMAYRKYEPNKGPLATYFNYTIRNRLIDLIRKNTRKEEKDAEIVDEEKQSDESLSGSDKGSVGERLEEEEFLKEVRSKLTEKQWNWVYYHVIRDMPLKEIAEIKGVSVDAVKSWRKEARKKLRQSFGDSGT